MGLNSGPFSLLISIWVTARSPTLPPPFYFNSRLHGNNGDALLHIVISTEEVFLRDPPVPGQSILVLAQVLENLTIFFAARLARQDADEELGDDRARIEGST